MASHKNTWKPDTCKCVIEYEFDDALPSEQVVLTGTDVKPCAAHVAGMAGKSHHEKYQHALGENQKKNRAVAEIEAKLGDEHFDIEEDWDGNVTRTLKRPPRFSFDADRKLKIELHSSHKGELAKLKKAVQDLLPDVNVE